MRLVACITRTSGIDQILTHRRSPENGPDAPPPRGDLQAIVRWRRHIARVPKSVHDQQLGRNQDFALVRVGQLRRNQTDDP
jgi:hypothetical protein